jgi:hypothetical protein
MGYVIEISSWNERVIYKKLFGYIWETICDKKDNMSIRVLITIQIYRGMLLYKILPE